MGHFHRALLWTGLILALFPIAALAQEPATPATPADSSTEPQAAANVVEDKGVRVEFTIEPSDDLANPGASVMEGEFAEVRFRITDAESGAPISPLEPAVWISRGEMTDSIPCRERVARYLQGTLNFQADIDLNKYFILILNNDRTISVIDPLLGVSGITQLYTMVFLPAPGEDWARSLDDQQLFVTLPQSGHVAVVELGSFKLVDSVETGGRPVRIALQPDGKYLWVGDDTTAEGGGGVTVIDAQSHKIVTRIPTGAGHHEIAFSDDSLRVFITNRADGTVTVVDVERLAKVRDLSVGKSPLAVAFSARSQKAYVASEDGTIAVVDGVRGEITQRLTTGAGLRDFRLDPSGRWAFAANVEQNRVDVIDASGGTLVQRLEVGEGPSELAFTDTYAYVRHQGTAEVTLIPLNQVGDKAMPGLQKVPLGNAPPGQVPNPAAAASIVPTGEWGAIVATNPADKMVYYYMEGMIAPMGSYTTYGRIPRAVGVVDRSVREIEKGVYGAKLRVPESGPYNVAFLIDSPWVHHCFAFQAEPNPQLAASKPESLTLELLNESREMEVGAPFRVRFTLSGSRSQAPIPGLGDVYVLAMRPPGQWQQRQRAEHLGEGRYEVQLLPDQPGVYYVSVAVPSLNVDFSELPYVSFRAQGRTTTGKEEVKP